MTKFFNACGLGIAFVATIAAAPAFAQTDQGPISVRVAYRDLDIGQADGAKALYARIKAASAEACGGAPDARVLGDRAAFDRCQRQSIDRALSHVASPAVTEMAGRGSGEVRVASR